MACKVISGLMILIWIAGVALFFINAPSLEIVTALILTGMGIPWNLTPIFTGGSEAFRTAFVLGAPIVNILIVWVLCRIILRRICPNC